VYPRALQPATRLGRRLVDETERRDAPLIGLRFVAMSLGLIVA
jgi:hypothetical protein